MPRVAAQLDDLCDPIEVAPVVVAAPGLEGAPVDGEPKQVEAELAHLVSVAGVEKGDVLEGNAAIVEGDVEDPHGARVHAAQRDLAAPLV